MSVPLLESYILALLFLFILLAEVWVSQPPSFSTGELSPLLICHVVAWAGERCPPSTSEAVGELALETGPYTMPGQPSRADPEGVGVGNLTRRNESRRTGPTHYSLL